MNVFELDCALVDRYAAFARSFSAIKAPEIGAQVSALYEQGKFWPDPLVTINPRFEQGKAIDELAADGVLDSALKDIFAVGDVRTPIRLHRHQERSVAKARNRESFVVTTGTGSGKSLCFFVPIIDAIVRARRVGESPRTRAIIIYPMNALANSQLGEITKFVGESGLPEGLRPTVARYTGQESQEEREAITKDKPDILLTNFMMLELLMTRPSDILPSLDMVAGHHSRAIMFSPLVGNDDLIHYFAPSCQLGSLRMIVLEKNLPFCVVQIPHADEQT